MKRRNLIKNACLMAAATVIPVQAATKPFDPMDIPYFKTVVDNVIMRRNFHSKLSNRNLRISGLRMFGELTEVKAIAMSAVLCYFGISPNYILNNDSFCSVEECLLDNDGYYFYIEKPETKLSSSELAQLKRYSLEKQLSFS